MDCPTCGKSLSTERGIRQHHTKVHDDPLPNRECADCGDEFYDPKSRRTYCDDCYSESGEKNGNYSGAKEPSECRICGSEFEYYPSDKDGNYCSGCLSEATGLLPDSATPDASELEVDCKNCSTTLQRYPAEVEDAEYGCFCDLSCYGEWLSENVVGDDHHQWEGGEFAYGESWWKVRRAALSRDDYECQSCGVEADQLERRPDVHHIKRVRAFDNVENAHKLENVVTLCRSCHRLVEAGEKPVPSVD